MGSIVAEIDEALERLQLTPETFQKCDDLLSQQIARKAMDNFVKGNPRVWWLSLKQPFAQLPVPEDELDFVKDHLPPEDSCWFIPETGENTYTVYDAKIVCIPQVLTECYYFEYNLVGKEFNWLIVETEHGVLIISRIKNPI